MYNFIEYFSSLPREPSLWRCLVTLLPTCHSDITSANSWTVESSSRAPKTKHINCPSFMAISRPSSLRVNMPCVELWTSSWELCSPLKSTKSHSFRSLEEPCCKFILTPADFRHDLGRPWSSDQQVFHDQVVCHFSVRHFEQAYPWPRRDQLVWQQPQSIKRVWMQRTWVKPVEGFACEKNNNMSETRWGKCRSMKFKHYMEDDIYVEGVQPSDEIKIYENK